jgi:hypothetical protein
MAGARRFLLGLALAACAHHAPSVKRDRSPLAPRDCAAAERTCRGERGCCAEDERDRERRCAGAARQCARCNGILGGCRARGLAEEDCRLLLAGCWEERPPSTPIDPPSP